MEKEKIDKQVLMNALWNTFPSVASFNDFKENDREISKRSIPQLIKYAFKNEIIAKQTEKAFIEFLEQNKKIDIDKPLPEELTFADVIEVLAGNISVNSLIKKLETVTKEMSLPPIKATMITRLKKHFQLNTAKKRTLLRILAFKLAENQPDLNWHYEMLRKITVGAIERPDPLKEKAGVTIAVKLQGKGEIIVPSDVFWLKSELAKCIEYLNLASHVHKKTIISSGAASFSLKLPKKQGPTEQPRLYDKAIRDILAIAHQMAVRWLLSEYSTAQKQLVIIIHAGAVSEANLAIQPLLETKLTSETGIYLTDFAYLCARVAEARVGLEQYREKANQTDGNLIDLWQVKYFWTYDYYDYIPYLLEKKMLPISITDQSYSEFQRALYFPEQFPESPFEALRAMYKFPQSSLLLIEIANVLRARQMPHEADAVLSNVLLANPDNVVARIMRMIINSNIAEAQNDVAISGIAFERAIAQGEFLVSLNSLDSAILSEFGAIYFNKAKKMIKSLRKGDYSKKQEISQEDISNCLKKAKEYFLKALAVSPTGRDATSLFWLLYVMCFMELLSPDENIPTKTERNFLVDSNDIFHKIGNRLFMELGWFGNESFTEENVSEAAFQNLLVVLAGMNARHDNSMLSRSYIPYTKYLFAVLLWDFTPHFTLGIYNMILYLLTEARTATEKLIADNLSVYRISTNYIAPDIFLLRLQTTIDFIEKLITQDDLKNGYNSPLPLQNAEEISKSKLMLLELDWDQA